MLETLRALDDLQGMGKILYAGVSCWSAEQIAQASQMGKKHGFRPLISDQPCYNLLNRGDERSVQGACEAAGMGWVIFSPLAQGVLTGKYASKKIPKGSRAADKARNEWLTPLLTTDILGRVARLEKIAKSKKMTTGQLALAWCLSNKVVASCIVGATSKAQIEENAGASGRELGAGTLAELGALFPLEGYR